MKCNTVAGVPYVKFNTKHAVSASAWRWTRCSQHADLRRRHSTRHHSPQPGPNTPVLLLDAEPKQAAGPPPRQQEGSFLRPKGGGCIVCASPTSTSRNCQHVWRQWLLHGHLNISPVAGILQDRTWTGLHFTLSPTEAFDVPEQRRLCPWAA